MIKTALYQDCHYIGYEEIPDLPTKFFCWKILKDGSFKEFSFFATDIDIILFGDYDKGNDQNIYIRVNCELQHYKKFDPDFTRFILSNYESRAKIFNLLRIRYPKANITIFEDAKIDVWYNNMVDCMEYKRVVI